LYNNISLSFLNADIQSTFKPNINLNLLLYSDFNVHIKPELFENCSAIFTAIVVDIGPLYIGVVLFTINILFNP